jgi:hypothetical protein
MLGPEIQAVGVAVVEQNPSQCLWRSLQVSHPASPPRSPLREWDKPEGHRVADTVIQSGMS